MKGDINFKINKKAGLGLIGALSLFAMADFVSIVDHKSAGGITVIEEKMTVGSIVLRMDSTNPADIYGGVWELVTGDASLALGDGTEQSGLISGENNPLIPIQEHNHTASFSGNSLPGHSHFTYANGSDSDQHPGGGNYISGSSFRHGKSSHSGQLTETVSAGTPTGSVLINNSGTVNARIDVRGKRLKVNVWKRVG